MKKIIILTTALALTGMGGVAMAKDHRGGGKMASFEELDTNNDGQISLEEMQARGAARFAEADANNDGSLSVDEMVANAKEGKEDRAKRRAERMIDRFDENDNGALELSELPRRGGERMFERVDADNSGGISKEEFEAAKEKRGGRKGGKKNKDSDS